MTSENSATSADATVASAGAVQDASTATSKPQEDVKGKGVQEDDTSMVDEDDDDEQEEDAEEGDDAEDEVEDGMEEIDASNIVGTRTRGKKIDWAEAAAAAPAEEEEESSEDDGDFGEGEDDEKMDED